MGGLIMKKWEISIMLAVFITIIWCAASSRFVPMWWTTAFSPLCDGILSSESSGGVELRSKFWELITSAVL